MQRSKYDDDYEYGRYGAGASGRVPASAWARVLTRSFGRRALLAGTAVSTTTASTTITTEYFHHHNMTTSTTITTSTTSTTSTTTKYTTTSTTTTTTTTTAAAASSSTITSTTSHSVPSALRATGTTTGGSPRRSLHQLDGTNQGPLPLGGAGRLRLPGNAYQLWDAAAPPSGAPAEASLVRGGQGGFTLATEHRGQGSAGAPGSTDTTLPDRRRPWPWAATLCASGSTLTCQSRRTGSSRYLRRRHRYALQYSSSLHACLLVQRRRGQGK
ncbi:hypothetical protein RJ55_04429 [Drechmeria coniospora]|nr:hypothetical protein RJ55_04429 [Drechmeria coniospora]